LHAALLQSALIDLIAAIAILLYFIVAHHHPLSP